MMNMVKKIAVLVLAFAVFALLCGTASAEPEAQGTCGDNLTWMLEDGKLTISGTGEMTDYTDYGSGTTTPWHDILKLITSVEIGSGVTSIGNYAFEDCSSLTGITIPNSVTRIGDSAFKGCYNLASVTIPNSVTRIGDGAFYCCFSLTSVTIPNSVTSIGRYVFYCCSSLASVTIPASVTSIRDSAFNGCSSLASVTIPDSVTSIGNYAFEDCSSLTGITIPASVTSIGNRAFEDCTSLLRFDVASGNTKYSAANGVLFNKNKNRLVKYPLARANKTYTIPDSVREIEPSAFSGCRNLTGVTIPDGVTEIGAYAFENCKSLSSVAIPDRMTFIGCSAFKGCKSLKKFKIPNGVKSVLESTFEDCRRLSSVTIPSSVESIEDKAFRGCGLKRISIPGSVTFIDSNAFDSFITIEAPCNSYAAAWAEKISYYLYSVAIHSWKDPAYTWAKDYSTVTAKRVCANDKTHKETETVETTYKVKKEPTYTKKGIGVYTSKAFTVSRAFKVQTKKVPIAMLPRTSITKVTIKAIDDQVYTGSAIKPKLSVKYNGTKLVKDTDYIVSFKDNVKPGKATVTITGKNAFKGKTTVTFSILPKKVKLVSLKPGKREITVTWKKGTAITGYDIEYSTRRDFSYAVMISVSSKTTLTTKIKHLTPGTTYYVRVRTYKEIGKKTYNSDWSAKMEATVPDE